MKTKLYLSVFFILLLILVVGCTKSPLESYGAKDEPVDDSFIIPQGQPVNLHIDVNPAMVFTRELGISQQLKAELVKSNGERVNVTSEATFSSGDDDVATITSSGLVTVVGFNEKPVYVTVSYQGFSKMVGIIAVEPEKEIPVIPLTLEVDPSLVFTRELGISQQLKAELVKSNGERVNVTSEATFSSGDDDVATITSSGLVTVVGFNEKPVYVTVSYQGFSKMVGIIAVEPEKEIPVIPLTLEVDPSLVFTRELGISQQLKAELVKSNGERVNVTSSATYSTDDPVVATVNSTGKVDVVGFNDKPTYVTVKHEGFEKKVGIVAVEPQQPVIIPKMLVSLTVSPVFVIGSSDYETKQVKLFANYANGETEEVTATANSTDNADVASASGNTVNFATGYGYANITFSYTEQTKTVSAVGVAHRPEPDEPVIIPKMLVSLTVSPVFVIGSSDYETKQVKLFANYANGETEEVTATANSTDNADVASASGNTVNFATGYGYANITFSYTEQTKTVSAVGVAHRPEPDEPVIIPKMLVSLTVSPVFVIGSSDYETKQVKLFANYANGETEEVTATANSTDNADVASASGNTVNFATGYGYANITFSYTEQTKTVSAVGVAHRPEPKPTTGILVINTNPGGATVKFPDLSPPEQVSEARWDDLEPGLYVGTVELAGYLKADIRVYIEAGQITQLHVTLLPKSIHPPKPSEPFTFWNGNAVVRYDKPSARSMVIDTFDQLANCDSVFAVVELGPAAQLDEAWQIEFRGLVTGEIIQSPVFEDLGTGNFTRRIAVALKNEPYEVTLYSRATGGTNSVHLLRLFAYK